MKKSSLLLALALTGLLATNGFAQAFIGSDNFDSGYNAARWDYVYRLNSATQGLLDFSNSRLDFSKAATGIGNQFRLWDSEGTAAANVNSLSYSTSWSMTMSTTNLMTGLTGAQFANIGIQVFNDANSYSALMLNVNSGGLSVRSEGTGFTATNTSIADNTDVLLRLTWDASGQTLAAAYSLDGTAFTSVATFLPTSQWNNATPATAVANGFNFGVFANSDTLAAISVGSIYADNFSVSAIPEPSTYAAFAGLGALGLAVWRRRQTRLAAVRA